VSSLFLAAFLFKNWPRGSGHLHDSWRRKIVNSRESSYLSPECTHELWQVSPKVISTRSRGPLLAKLHSLHVARVGLGRRCVILWLRLLLSTTYVLSSGTSPLSCETGDRVRVHDTRATSSWLGGTWSESQIRFLLKSNSLGKASLRWEVDESIRKSKVECGRHRR